MPQYDFLCQGCKKPFSKTLTLAEYDRGKVSCPRCGSKRVEQKFCAFFAVTSKKSA